MKLTRREYSRTAGKVVAWQITDDDISEQANALQRVAPKGWQIYPDTNPTHGHRQIRVRGPGTTGSVKDRPRFLLNPGDILVLDDNSLYRWVAPLFHAIHKPYNQRA